MSRAARELTPPSARVPAWFWWSAAALVAVTFLTYAPVLRGDWIWDDDYYVTRNATLDSAHGLWRIWTDIGAVPQYYPLTHTTFWIEWRLWGDQPTGYHVANVVLHCANAILVGVLLRCLAVPGWWIVPWLFALHPVHVESVAWVTERKNVLSGFFYLLALHTYLKAFGLLEGSGFGVQGSGGERKGTQLFLSRGYVMALVLFICALLSKSVTSSLPAVVLLIVYWKRGRITMRDVVPLLPFFALGAGMGALTSWMEQHVVGAQGAEWNFSIADRVLIAGRAVWFYATKLIWSHPLIFMYPRWRIDDGALWQYVFPLAALGVVASLWGLRHRLGRGPLVAALFFGGTLVPALGFVNVLPMRYSFVADHFQYLASLGALTLIGAAIAIYASRAAVAVTTVVSLALAVVSWNHAHDFVDIETLWQRTLAKNPSSWMAENNYGTLLYDRGDYAGAAEHFLKSIRIKPDHDQPRLNLGLLAERQGDRALARRWFLDAIAVAPRFPQGHYNLGRLAAAEGNADEAIRYYQRAIELDPRYDEAMTNLGVIYADRGEVDRAVELYRRALAVNPYASAAHVNLGNAHLSAGRIEEALAEWARAAEIQPRNPVIPHNIGALLARLGRLDEAERQFRASLSINPNYVDALANLAAVRARKGDAAGARQLLNRALSLDPGNEKVRQQFDSLPR